MSQLGYNALTGPYTYSSSQSQATNIIKRAPLLVSSSIRNSTSPNDPNQDTEGHVWVMDGYLLYAEIWNAIANPTHTILHSMVHFVWGWGGQSNGYFILTSSDNFGNFTPDDFAVDDTQSSARVTQIFRSLSYYSEFQPNR